MFQHLADVLHYGGRPASSVHAADEATVFKTGLRAVNIDVLGPTEGLDEGFVAQGG